MYNGRHDRYRKKYSNSGYRPRPQRRKLALKKPSFRIKENEFPSLPGQAQRSDATQGENISYSKLFEEKMSVPKPKKAKTKDGWVVWKKTPDTQLWDRARGAESRHRRAFKKWLKEKKEKDYENKKMKMYVDYMLEREMQEERDGPTYIQPWQKEEDIEKSLSDDEGYETPYDSSDSEDEEFIHCDESYDDY